MDVKELIEGTDRLIEVTKDAPHEYATIVITVKTVEEHNKLVPNTAPELYEHFDDYNIKVEVDDEDELGRIVAEGNPNIYIK